MHSSRPDNYNYNNNRGGGGPDRSYSSSSSNRRDLDNSSRSHPYRSNGITPPVSYFNTPRTKIPEGKWGNDLFAEGSSADHPFLTSSGDNPRRGIPNNNSTTIREFGTASALPHLPIASPFALSNPTSSSTTTAAAAAAATTTTTSSDNLFSRLGIKGSSALEAEKRKQLELTRLAREQEKKARVLREQEDRNRKEMMSRWERENAKLIELVRIEERGFVVEVAGLVFGTSAEDVQTAFGQYGETTHCIIVNGENAREGDDLVARLVFERYSDAEEAVQKLNGAVADGKPLRVRRGIKTVIPPPPTFTKKNPVVQQRQSPATSIVLEAPIPVGIPGSRKMYADVVEAYIPVKPVASTSTLVKDSMGITMDVEMEVEEVEQAATVSTVPTGPRGGNGRSGRGRGNGRGTSLSGASGSQRKDVTSSPAAASSGGGSLMSRLGGGGNSGNVRNGGSGSKGPVGLLGRLSVS